MRLSRAARVWVTCAGMYGVLAGVSAAQAEEASTLPRVLELQYTPTGRAQIAIWIEDESGEFMATVGLTDAVAVRGLGNRPGASQMNSGFRWPFGRREGVLPIWAHRRAVAPGAKQWKRIIFQDRPEGWASRKREDSSPDNYYCLAWDQSRSKRDALDAVSCASVFASDKGRYIKPADVQMGYGEPYEDVDTHEGRVAPLGLTSLYPPRRDVMRPCGSSCAESTDVADYVNHARDVMPDIDAVSMATPPGGQPVARLFMVPEDWGDGSYRACLEINVEGDYNATFDPEHLPMPKTPTALWDSWATTQGYGYPYRGQPSVVYCVPFNIGSEIEETFTVDEAEGSGGSWDTAAPSYGKLSSMDDMTNDPQRAPGSGADRLRRDGSGHRFTVIVKPAISCDGNQPPSEIEQLSVKRYPKERHAHEWAGVDFEAASDDTSVFRYDVRVSTEPITDETSFMRGQPAKDATIAAEELRVPVSARAGNMIHVDMGGLVQGTHYYVGVRAVDGCSAASPIAVAEITTPMRVFATVTPCFVATAAYGSPLAAEIGALRRLRDRYLATHAIGQQLVAAYGVIGPALADHIREHDSVRAAVRTLLTPLVAMARWLED